MDRLDRIYHIHRILSDRRTPIRTEELEDRLECSRSTVMRDIGWLRDIMGAPAEYIKPAGYFYDRKQGDFELPGLWLNDIELQSLLSMHHLVENLQPGVLSSLIDPIRDRITELLNARHLAGSSVPNKVKIIAQSARAIPTETYRTVVQSLAQNKMITIRYQARQGAKDEVRKLSPQKLIRYRDNWYVDAWCHNRDALRSFSLDRIREIDLSEDNCISVEDDVLLAHYAGAYGIYAGEASERAVLKFSPFAAEWVADESWHPKQQGEWLEDGSYQLTLPYNQTHELIGEIMRWTPEVEIIAPESLKDTVVSMLAKALDKNQR